MKVLAETLKEKLAEHGISILDQERRLNAMLCDLYPNKKRLLYLLGLSLRAKIPQKFEALRNETSSFRDTQIISIRHCFKEDFSLEENAVSWVFDCWNEVFPCMSNTENEVKQPSTRKVTSSDPGLANVSGIKYEENVTDIDGNIYKTIEIGNQIWMAENLCTTRYRNGDLINTTIPAAKNIYFEKSPKYQWIYDGNDILEEKYGRLYTWYAATDNRNIAPKGWKVASDNDWLILEEYLVKSNYNLCPIKKYNIIANSLASKIYWNESQLKDKRNAVGSINIQDHDTGLCIVPNGFKNVSGIFNNINITGAIWTSTENSKNSAWYRCIDINCTALIRNSYSKFGGFSIRCLKD